jgi:DNA polymerase I-like protein with 3'-5' exonuclease and polymerase domains
MSFIFGVHGLATLATATTVAFDCETLQLQPEIGKLRLLQFAAIDRDPVVIDCFDLDEDGWDKVDEFFAMKRYWIAHNAVFDLGWLQEHGIRPTGTVQCSMLASRLLLNGMPNVKHGLQHVVQRWLKIELPKELQKSDWSGELTPEQIEYAVNDVAVLIQLDGVINQHMAKAALHTAWALENAALPAMAQLWRTGLPFDKEMLNQLQLDLEQEQERLKDLFIVELDEALPKEEKLPRNEDGSFNLRAKTEGSVRLGTKKMAGFNINSPSQLVRALTILLGKAPVDADGKPSASRQALRQYAADHAVVGRYMEWKRVEKRRQMVESLIQAQSDDGRIRASYMQLGADTGRMSCMKPNLQQVPRDQNFRACVQAPEGKLLVVADFAQMELRLAAAEAKDDTMIAAFQEEKDLHTLTAMEIYGVEEAAVTKEQRQIAKSANFGLLFGSGAKGLREYAGSMGIQMDLEEAHEIREAFHRAYPGINKWQRANAVAADSSGANAYIFIQKSRMRRFLVGENNKLTTRCNTPVQGAGAAVMKRTLGLLWPVLLKYGEMEVKLAGVVHDEVILEVKEGTEEKWAKLLQRAMEKAEAVWLGDVPALAEAKWGKSWAEAK